MLNKKASIHAVSCKNGAIAKNPFAKKSIVNVSTQVFHAQMPVNVLSVTIGKR